MGSNYFGEMSIGSGNERSSRRSRKNNHSEKPKQPQRGLGVAQLEKMRLHGQIPSSSSYLSPYPTTTVFNQEDLSLQTPYSSSSSSSSSLSSSSSYGFQSHPSFLMGLNEFSRANINFCDSQASTVRWTNTASNGHFFNAQEDIQKKPKKNRGDRMIYSQNCETSDGDDELDLELRL